MLILLQNMQKFIIIALLVHWAKYPEYSAILRNFAIHYLLHNFDINSMLILIKLESRCLAVKTCHLQMKTSLLFLLREVVKGLCLCAQCEIICNYANSKQPLLELEKQMYEGPIAKTRNRLCDVFTIASQGASNKIAGS